MVATGMEEVLVARIAVGATIASRAGEQGLFGVKALDDGFDDQGAGAEIGEGFGDVKVGEGGVAGLWCEFASGDAGGQRLFHPGAGMSRGRGRGRRWRWWESRPAQRLARCRGPWCQGR